MKIVLIGQASFGKDCLQALLEENIVGVITIPDDPKGRANPLKDFALEKNIPVFQPPGESPNRLRNPRVKEIIKALKPDLFVLAFVSDIMPYEITKMAKLGGINYHPSLLPKYRGASAMNWAIINGEEETGVTIHYIDEGVDTGDIILQEKVTILPEDTMGSLYFDKLYPLGVKLIKEAVCHIRQGRVKALAQDEGQASYQPMIKSDDVKIDWQKSTPSILNLIRGASPLPGAHSLFRAKKIKILDGQKAERIGKRQPGEVVDISNDQGFKLASDDGAILVKRIQVQGEKKMTAGEFAQANHLQVGEIFG